MRVLHINPYFFPYRGGIERRIWGLSKELVKLGHEMHVLTSLLPGTSPEETVDGLRVHRLESTYRGLGRLNPPFVSTRGVWAAVRDIAPDVIDFHYRWAPSYTRAVKRARKEIPVVLTFHNTFGEGVGLEGRLSRLSDSLFQFFARKCDLIVCVSDFIRRDLEGRALPPDKLRVVYNGIDPTPEDEVARLRETPGRAPAPYGVFAGRIVRTKGLNTLIEAAGEIKAPVTFYLCGEGPELEALRRQARESHVEDRVKLLGYTDEERKRALIAQADLMVHPATFESFGISLLEAIDLGCPVVSTQVGGIDEVVGEAGVLVPAGESALLARAVDALIVDPDRRLAMGRAGRARAQRFAWSRLAPQAQAAYEQAVRARAAAA